MMRRSSESKIAIAMPSSGSGCNQRTTKAAAVSGGGGGGTPPLLPDEMIMEVLLRLPVKSILHFRAVCRSWAALFSTEQFCSLHTATAAKTAAPQKLLFVSPTAARSREVYSRCCSPASGSAPDEEDELLFTIDSACGNSMQVLTPASCRGLTLLYDAIAPAYYICKAATRAVTRLPPFVDVYSRCSTGLGFDARTRKYKVLRLVNDMSFNGEEMIRCEVYTHGGGHGDRCWRSPTGEVPLGLRMYAGSAVLNSALNNVPPVFSKGFLHWLVNPSWFLESPSVAVISFSLAEETFSSVRPPLFWAAQVYPFPLPAFFDPYVLGEHLGEMDNQLCMVRDLRSYPDGGWAVEIWKLPDCSSGAWSMKHRIDLLERVARVLCQPPVVRVVGSTSNGNSGKKIIIIIATSMHTYDLSSHALETILSVTETHTSIGTPNSRFSLFEEPCMLRCINTDEWIDSRNWIWLC